MCPVCVSTTGAMLIAGIATPATVLMALVVKKFGVKIIPVKENGDGKQ